MSRTWFRKFPGVSDRSVCLPDAQAGVPSQHAPGQQLLSGPVPFLLFSEEEQSAPTAASVLTPF